MYVFLWNQEVFISSVYDFAKSLYLTLYIPMTVFLPWMSSWKYLFLGNIHLQTKHYIAKKVLFTFLSRCPFLEFLLSLAESSHQTYLGVLRYLLHLTRAVVPSTGPNITTAFFREILLLQSGDFHCFLSGREMFQFLSDCRYCLCPALPTMRVHSFMSFSLVYFFKVYPNKNGTFSTGVSNL